ncbi:hypothetical protein NEMIN01_0159 [Nematocida minor]|uniref:uncharacterized protein n=1 Tax=Nematocida minor TaxID=1912983 RepID=UPI00222078AD|nr:uncharacterized protein NEMIN01_0055 [Nematocida minor]XP_051332061.1 uncharacterized protein NEMIN01_0159 [Nematocida minor]KAI5188791.1 hypothetical protein NEMIN01_0055 [Nematocida minor]KAI5188895.1 hypothetical protein NEMIN01_0159 [Nematocida minor]
MKMKGKYALCKRKAIISIAVLAIQKALGGGMVATRQIRLEPQESTVVFNSSSALESSHSISNYIIMSDIEERGEEYEDSNQADAQVNAREVKKIKKRKRNLRYSQNSLKIDRETYSDSLESFIRERSKSTDYSIYLQKLAASIVEEKKKAIGTVEELIKQEHEAKSVYAWDRFFSNERIECIFRDRVNDQYMGALAWMFMPSRKKNAIVPSRNAEMVSSIHVNYIETFSDPKSTNRAIDAIDRLLVNEISYTTNKVIDLNNWMNRHTNYEYSQTNEKIKEKYEALFKSVKGHKSQMLQSQRTSAGSNIPALVLEYYSAIDAEVSNFLLELKRCYGESISHLRLSITSSINPVKRLSKSTTDYSSFKEEKANIVMKFLRYTKDIMELEMQTLFYIKNVASESDSSVSRHTASHSVPMSSKLDFYYSSDKTKRIRRYVALEDFKIKLDSRSILEELNESSGEHSAINTPQHTPPQVKQSIVHSYPAPSKPVASNPPNYREHAQPVAYAPPQSPQRAHLQPTRSKPTLTPPVTAESQRLKKLNAIRTQLYIIMQNIRKNNQYVEIAKNIQAGGETVSQMAKTETEYSDIAKDLALGENATAESIFNTLQAKESAKTKELLAYRDHVQRESEQLQQGNEILRSMQPTIKERLQKVKTKLTGLIARNRSSRVDYKKLVEESKKKEENLESLKLKELEKKEHIDSLNSRINKKKDENERLLRSISDIEKTISKQGKLESTTYNLEKVKELEKEQKKLTEKQEEQKRLLEVENERYTKSKDLSTHSKDLEEANKFMSSLKNTLFLIQKEYSNKQEMHGVRDSTLVHSNATISESSEFDTKGQSALAELYSTAGVESKKSESEDVGSIKEAIKKNSMHTKDIQEMRKSLAECEKEHEINKQKYLAEIGHVNAMKKSYSNALNLQEQKAAAASAINTTIGEKTKSMKDKQREYRKKMLLHEKEMEDKYKESLRAFTTLKNH